MDFSKYQNFSQKEFDSPDAAGSGALMKEDFIRQLQNARFLSVVPFRISSGYRTFSHNQKVGGAKASSHLYGYAADIKIFNNYERHEILKSLVEVGFSRIGIGKNFIHVDADPNKVINRIWTY